MTYMISLMFLWIMLVFLNASSMASPNLRDESISFLDHCSFDNENLCEMSVCSRSDHGWERVTNVTGGPHSDHTYIGMESQAGFFMHSSTVNGQEGDTTKLETRKMTPSRDCKVQCLQFFYYHSGHESDQLNIWIREFDSEADAHGTRRLMGQITGTPANYWQLHHVPLNATKRFQMEFESRKGAGSSTGGFSVDDINLSETECPHNIWQIRNFEEIWNSSHSLKGIYSPKYYSPEGYGYQATVTFSRDVVKCYVRVVSGPYDDQLQWPCLLRQISIVLLDQNPHIEQRMSRQRSITSDGRWGNPREVGTPIGKNNNAVYATDWFYTAVYVEKKNPKDRTFVKGGEAFLFFSMKDISGLTQNDTLPCPSVPKQNFIRSPEGLTDKGPCAKSECLDIFCNTATSMVPSAVMLLMALILALH